MRYFFAKTVYLVTFVFQRRLLFLPLLSGALMLLASISPWLHDPLGSLTAAWQIPVDTGWSVHSPFLNYGLLCALLAVSIWFLAFVYSFSSNHGSLILLCLFRIRGKTLLCLVPFCLFFTQMLFCSFSSMALIAHHARQALLIQRLFLYPGVDQLIPLRPFVLHDSTLWGRLQLLIDYLDYGVLLPLLACCLLVLWLNLSHKKGYSASTRTSTFQWRVFLLPLALCLLFCLVFARAFVGTLLEKQAQSALSSGSYSSALSLLSTASLFLPELNDAAFYHLERGQALYYLSPVHLSPDAQAYLAASYRAQQDFPSAFQQDYALWKISSSTPWISFELSDTLEAWLDSLQPLNSNMGLSLKQTATSLSWLGVLEHVDSTNVYAWYLQGRVSYAFHSYSACILSLSHVLLLSQEPAILSSVYTYLALSKMGLGDLATGRALLFEALTLDSGYRNNMAREALSGLH